LDVATASALRERRDRVGHPVHHGRLQRRVAAVARPVGVDARLDERVVARQLGEGAVQRRADELMQLRLRTGWEAGLHERGVHAARERHPRVGQHAVEIEDDGVGLQGRGG
jgi:hypothetical protein